MPPMSAARQRALRAVLTALTGGGLTAASLGGSLPAQAIADAPAGSAAEGSTSAAPQGSGESSAAASTTTTTTTTTTTSTPSGSGTATGTTTTPQPSRPAAPSPAPTVVLQRHQRTTPKKGSKQQTATSGKGSKQKNAAIKATGPNNVALSPQVIAAQASALASSEASIQALGFYRIPLFLLPIYKAAAVQYGVPWQILAAVNEIETNYGSDLSVSSAGAVGWMQFMPETWLQYGVDALNAGYADPMNPVDAVFAAARYLRAAGAAKDLHGAILAYNHSEEYVSSVLLRAKLISTYPSSVIATLTGLIDGRPPVTGRHLAWAPPVTINPPASSATAGAAQSPPAGSAPAPSAVGATIGAPHASAPTTPGSSAAPTPAVAAARASAPARSPMLLSELTSATDAQVVAVQNGRVVQIGSSAALGRYLVLRDVYGDVFTYAGLGHIAPTYTLARSSPSRITSPLVEVASRKDPTPKQAASAGFQSPVTLNVRSKPRRRPGNAGQASLPEGAEGGRLGHGKVRLFAHPGNPDARAAAVADASAKARLARASRTLQLRRGAVVSSGTVLGSVAVTPGAHSGHIRFAVRPAGDPSTVDPGPILANWAQLQAALHPQGAKSQDALLGATASDVFLLSKSELQRAVLSDPGISIYACGRRDITAGLVDKRVLAVLAFLSRSGLRPTVSALRCGQSPVGRGRRPQHRLQRRRRADHSHQRHAGGRPPGHLVDHRPHDPHADGAPRRIPARADPQPDALPGRPQHARLLGLLEPRRARIPRRLRRDRDLRRHGRLARGEARTARERSRALHRRAQLRPVGPADRADRGAAHADRRAQALLGRDPGPQAPLTALHARAVIARGLPGGRLR